VALVWPEVDGVLPVISAKATWLDAEKMRHETRIELDPSLAPATQARARRDNARGQASRAAR
jgi:hypothetical protein